LQQLASHLTVMGTHVPYVTQYNVPPGRGNILPVCILYCLHKLLSICMVLGADIFESSACVSVHKSRFAAGTKRTHVVSIFDCIV